MKGFSPIVFHLKSNKHFHIIELLKAEVLHHDLKKTWGSRATELRACISKTHSLASQEDLAAMGASLTYYLSNKSQALQVLGYNRIAVVDPSGNQKPDDHDT